MARAGRERESAREERERMRTRARSVRGPSSSRPGVGGGEHPAAGIDGDARDTQLLALTEEEDKGNFAKTPLDVPEFPGKFYRTRVL